MKDLKNNPDAELTARIADAMRHLGFFIYQRGVDDPAAVSRVLNRAGAANLVEVLMAGHGIYVVLPSERACRTICKYERCREAEDHDKCIQECMKSCLKELALKVSEMLQGLTRHVRGPG